MVAICFSGLRHRPRPSGRGLSAVAVILALPLVPAPARAQARPVLQPGARVRFVARLGGTDSLVTGQLLLFTPDTVTIVLRRAVPPSVTLADLMREHVAPVHFALRDVTRFEVNRGQPRAIVYGAPAAGAALGALVGATILAPDGACDLPGNPDTSCHWVTPPAIVGAAGGVVLSSLAVRLFVPEIWQEVPLTAFTLGSVGRARGRFGIGLTLHVR